MDPRPPASPHRTLLLLTLAGLALRIAFVLLEPATHPVADERTWTNWAVENLVTPKVSLLPWRTHMIFYPPLYPYFIAVPYLLFGSLAAAQWIQAALSSLLIPAVGRIGLAAYGERAGLAAAAVTAFYPDLVWFSAHFWSETVFMVLLWWAVERLLAADARRALAPALGAGLLWGLAILTRETILYFTPVAALWLVWVRPVEGRRVAAGATFLLAALLTVVPWTIRNWIVFKAFVPVSTAGGLNLYQGNAPLSRQEVYDRYEAVQGRIEQYRFARREGLQAILDRQPTWLLEKLRDEMPNFWEADSLALIHVKRGAYGAVRPAAAVAAAVVVLTPYLAVLVLFVLGLAAFGVDRRNGLLLAFLAYYNLIHVVTHGFARYRLPAMPVLFVVAAAAWTHLHARTFPSLAPARRAAALAVGAVLAACLVPSFRQNLSHPAFGFVDQAGPASGDAPPP